MFEPIAPEVAWNASPPTRITVQRYAYLACLGLTILAAQARAAEPTPSITESSINRPTTLPQVVVTADSLGSDLLNFVAPAIVLSGKELTFRQESTLGETLSKTPGISSTYYGPNASRPVIRGLDGDRVRIMQNGIGVLDVSALSPDHATAVDPLLVDRIEVVRGPGALMYGSSAIGDVVNASDNRIPQLPAKEFTGRAESRVGGAANERSGATVLETGNDLVALHADVASRRTDDLRIPGFAHRGALDGNTTSGHLTNSSSSSDSGAIGASLTLDKGYLGLSYSDLRANYGTVAQSDVRVDMKTSRLGIAGEVRELGTFIDGVKFKYNHTDYSHNELESGVVGTTFTNKGYETRVDATHTKLGPLSGAFGMQLSNTDFAAIGTEAFVPKVNTDTRALFAYEEAALGNTKLSASVRNEHASLESAGGDHFGAAQTRSFSASSGSFGTLHTINPSLNWATNLSHTERVPTYAELFANGRHVATGQFEVGNTALSKEKSNGADTQLRWHSGLSSASIGGFYNRFPSYIALIKTNDPPVGGLPVAAFRATRAELYGFEMEEKTRVYETKGSLDLSLRSDYVRAKNLDTGDSLPRIAPMRFGAGLDYRLDKLGARLDVTHSMRQNQVAANELPTDGYTLTNAMVDYHFKTQAINWETYLKGNNLFNQEARMHTSTLKEIAPLPGRGLMMGIRGNF